MTLEQQVIDCMVEQSGAAAEMVKLSDTLDTHGMDSLDYVEFIEALEEKFNVEIDETDLTKESTLQQYVDKLRELGVAG